MPQVLLRPLIAAVLCLSSALINTSAQTHTSAQAQAATLTLQPGQTGTLGQQKITVVRVQDSRCRPATNCIRAGEIIAKVLVTQGRHSAFLTLQYPPAPKTAPAPALTLEAATFDRPPRLTFGVGEK